MNPLVTPAIDVQTSPLSVPSVPAWFAEAVILAHHLTQTGFWEAISTRVQLARGRAPIYEVSDFVALLLGYAISDEPTLQAFFARVSPFAQPFMALFGRAALPHRASLSRFLAAVDAPALAALRQQFEQYLFKQGFSGDLLGGFFDRHGQRLLVFDVDATRQAARQRALITDTDHPTPRRRMAQVCAPGYTGRKRGEVVRTRTTILQAHTQQWLGTFAGAGNGDYGAELEQACQVIASYMRTQGMNVAHGLLRLDGLYGTASVLARVQHYGLGFLVRGRDYQLLEHPRVQARLQHPSDGERRHPETKVCREVFDVGYIDDWLEPLPGFELTCRVVVARRAAPANDDEIVIGKRKGEYVYELFLTSHPTQQLSALEVLDVYHQRGSFEQVLSDEDTEQHPDRWCSHTSAGQEFWQVLSQWVWNVRLKLGYHCQEGVLRQTQWTSGGDATIATPTDQAQAEVPQASVGVEEVVDTYGPLEWAGEWAKSRGRFSGQDFELLEDGTLQCPASKILRPRERRTLPSGDLRILYAAKQADCRSCTLAERCLGVGASGATARRVSAYRKHLGQHKRPTLVPWRAASREHHTEQDDVVTPRVLIWSDIGGRCIRREFFVPLRQQQVAITTEGGQPQLQKAEAKQAALQTRSRRAHRRLSWEVRRTRNAITAEQSRFSITVCGVPAPLAAYLGLPSRSAV